MPDTCANLAAAHEISELLTFPWVQWSRGSAVGRRLSRLPVSTPVCGADVAAGHGEVLVAGDVSDLALFDAGGRGRRLVADAEGVTGEQGAGKSCGLRTGFDNQRDPSVRESPVG